MSNDVGHAEAPGHKAPSNAPVEMHGLSPQLIYDTAPIGLAFLSPDCRYLQINKQLTELCGLPVEDHLGRSVHDCVPALSDAIEAIVRSILETGEPVTGVEVAGQRLDEAVPRSWVTYWHPVRGGDGEIVGINVAAKDITERKQAEQALRASEQQFRTLADSIPQLVWMSDADGAIFWFNSPLAAFAAPAAADIPGRDWLDVLGPDAGHEDWARSLQTGAPLMTELNLRGKDGQCHRFLTRALPLHGPGGSIHRWIGTHVDIDEIKEREEHSRLIADEVSHRSKNLLAVVMAIAQQTAKHSDDVGQYYTRFAARLTALAHCHDLLVRDRWRGASFGELVDGQLKPFGEINQDRIEAVGPPIIVSADAVQYLGLAFHELATNASKYGALSGPEGRISIRWWIDEPASAIHVTWCETGGPAVTPPRRHGFGRVIIEQIVPRALKGSGSLDYPPEGVLWALQFPAHEARASSIDHAPQG